MQTCKPGFPRLLGALLYEGLTVFSVLLAGFLFPQIVLHAFGLEPAQKLLWVHIFLLLLAYFGWCWSNGGQTLAMKSWRLRIVDISGQPLRPLQALLRYCAAWVSIPFGIGILWALFDHNRSFLHDRLAGTKIVYEPKQS